MGLLRRWRSLTTRHLTKGALASHADTEEDIDVHALRRQGMSISAIARHLGRDRKTIRAYLAGGRVAGERKPAEADPFEVFVDYVRARLTEDPHLWAVTLFDEVAGLGYDRSYPTFTRQLRARGLRPHCEPCSAVDALDKTTRKLGGLTRKWRFDRMSTVCHPESGKVTVTFAAVAKYYGVQVAICPPRRGNRKGVVEKSNHTAAQRWWRTLPDDTTVEEAQASLDRFCELRGDARLRPSAVDRAARVLTIAEQEPLAPVPTAPFPPDQRGTDRVRPGAGRLARDLLLRPTRAGPRPRRRLAAARRPASRHRHQQRDRDRPPSARTRRRRGDGPRPRSRDRARRSSSWPATTPAVRTAARSASARTRRPGSGSPNLTRSPPSTTTW